MRKVNKHAPLVELRCGSLVGIEQRDTLLDRSSMAGRATLLNTHEITTILRAYCHQRVSPELCHHSQHPLASVHGMQYNETHQLALHITLSQRY